MSGECHKWSDSESWNLMEGNYLVFSRFRVILEFIVDAGRFWPSEIWGRKSRDARYRALCKPRKTQFHMLFFLLHISFRGVESYVAFGNL
jgi:hypothetical protein